MANITGKVKHPAEILQGEIQSALYFPLDFGEARQAFFK